MTLDEVVDHCLSLDGAFRRYPFEGYRSGVNPLVMTVQKTKMFCVIYEDSNPLHITLKCDPLEADFLRSVYSSVKPGYHFNKTHWNSVYLDGTIPDEEIKQMIYNSYRLVNGKKHAK